MYNNGLEEYRWCKIQLINNNKFHPPPLYYNFNRKMLLRIKLLKFKKKSIYKSSHNKRTNNNKLINSLKFFLKKYLVKIMKNKLKISKIIYNMKSNNKYRIYIN